MSDDHGDRLPRADGSDAGDETRASDPAVVERIVVHATDVTAALEARSRERRETVLRLTPPFAARQRARLHVAGAESDPGYDAVHVHPGRFADDPPPFPSPDDTADEVDGAAEFDRERHRRTHERAVERWRSSVADALRSRIDHPALGAVTVDYLGTSDAGPG